jgi:NTE family protein
MLFHVGVITRLNEAKLLPKLNRISSVSGGSITAGVLGLNWRQLDFQAGTPNEGTVANLEDQLVQPIRTIASETLDGWAIGLGAVTPGMSIGDYVAKYYRRYLFGEATLQDLPNDSVGPRFVINATSVQTGAVVRFSRPYVADYLVGRILNPRISLALAVAASSAFPPVLSPVTIDVNPDDFEVDPRCALQRHPFNDRWVLTDGGVYDNLGLETVEKNYQTILVSDGGGKIAPEELPASNWAEHSKRILDIVHNQVRSLRKRHLIESFVNKTHSGAFWGIRTNIADYKLPAALPTPHAKTMILAETPTRLKALSEQRQNQLMNWGYAVRDAALRKHVKIFCRAASTCQRTFSGWCGLIATHFRGEKRDLNLRSRMPVQSRSINGKGAFHGQAFSRGGIEQFTRPAQEIEPRQKTRLDERPCTESATPPIGRGAHFAERPREPVCRRSCLVVEFEAGVRPSTAVRDVFPGSNRRQGESRSRVRRGVSRGLGTGPIGRPDERSIRDR